MRWIRRAPCNSRVLQGKLLCIVSTTISPTTRRIAFSFPCLFEQPYGSLSVGNDLSTGRQFKRFPSWIVSFATAITLSYPIFIWFRDNMYSLRRVNGFSMIPTLQPGDVILVRQSERGILADILASIVLIPFWNIFAWTGLFDADKKSTLPDPTSLSASAEFDDVDSHLQQIHQYEIMHGALEHAIAAKWYDRPITVLPGHIVVFDAPNRYPPQSSIKRAIGVGGQFIIGTQIINNSIDQNGRQMVQYRPSRFSWRTIPSFTIHVEGDNIENSEDSRMYGPVSKNLVHGIAEIIVWPPSRWQVLKRQAFCKQDGGDSSMQYPENHHSRAFWP
jgi:signal peptidase I